MTGPGSSLGDVVSAKVQESGQTPHERISLSVAILGPGLGTDDDQGAVKRMQIRDALANDGHSPFFPEEIVTLNQSSEAVLEEERQILSRPNVDLVIILHTSTSFGALMEIANFVSVPEIKAKTAVLFPSRYYTPDESIPGNTVRAYLIKFAYTDEHFRVCQLVSECRKWACERAIGNWPAVVPHGF